MQLYILYGCLSIAKLKLTQLQLFVPELQLRKNLLSGLERIDVYFSSATLIFLCLDCHIQILIKARNEQAIPCHLGTQMIWCLTEIGIINLPQPLNLTEKKNLILARKSMLFMVGIVCLPQAKHCHSFIFTANSYLKTQLANILLIE